MNRCIYISLQSVFIIQTQQTVYNVRTEGENSSLHLRLVLSMTTEVVSYLRASADTVLRGRVHFEKHGQWERALSCSLHTSVLSILRLHLQPGPAKGGQNFPRKTQMTTLLFKVRKIPWLGAKKGSGKDCSNAGCIKRGFQSLCGSSCLSAWSGGAESTQHL